ncbi:MAG TPA: cytochrome C oxidase subunit IV family protein [Gemmatimonadales bacterium]|nr:cytochrome C oxidase subunit IV family protein [Gemmatimonadales bacterium]
MNAHADAAPAETHDHPGWKTYTTIALILFVLTALEVVTYSIHDGSIKTSLASFVDPIFVLLLVVLSAAKFALVAAFYMHLKNDSPLFSGAFVFPILVAVVIILALFGLFTYNRGLQHIFG